MEERLERNVQTCPQCLSVDGRLMGDFLKCI